MSLTLLESSKYSQDKLQKGVIQVIAKESAVLELLPFMEIVGNAYAYNTESTEPNIEFRNVNEGYTEGSAEIVQKSEALVILGGDIDLDLFLVKTRSNINDIRAIQTELKAKKVSNQFSLSFFKGDTGQDPKSFDGMNVRIAAAGQELAVQDGTNGYLALDDLNALLDMVDDGDVLYMGKKVRREVMKILQTSQHYIQDGTDEFGRTVQLYNGIPIRIVGDTILDMDEGVGTDEGSIYYVKFGAMSDVCGLTNGGVQVRDLGELDTKPVLRTRIEWYCGLAQFRDKSSARLTGIKANNT